MAARTDSVFFQSVFLNKTIIVGDTGALLVIAAVATALVGGGWLVIFEKGISRLPPEQN